MKRNIKSIVINAIYICIGQKPNQTTIYSTRLGTQVTMVLLVDNQSVTDVVLPVTKTVLNL